MSVKKLYNGQVSEENILGHFIQKSRKCVILPRWKIAEMCINTHLKNLGKVIYETKNPWWISTETIFPRHTSFTPKTLRPKTGWCFCRFIWRRCYDFRVSLWSSRKANTPFPTTMLRRWQGRFQPSARPKSTSRATRFMSLLWPHSERQIQDIKPI